VNVRRCRSGSRATGGELSGVDSLGYSEESRLAALSTDYGAAQTALFYDGRGFLRRSQLGYTNSADTLTAEPASSREVPSSPFRGRSSYRASAATSGATRGWCSTSTST
jgi:hypothetical protein